MLLQIFIFLIIILAGLFAFFRWFERYNVWQPSKRMVSDPSALGYQYEEVTFQTSDGINLNGWFIPAINSKACVLFCHGNAGNISHRIETIRHMQLLNLDMFIFDYRGFGKSEGILSERGTLNDARAAYEWLKKKVPGKPMIIFGRSLGASIGCHLAAKVEAKGFVCESTFKSVHDLGQTLFPYLPVKWISSIRYRTIEAIKNVNIPVLIIHSKDDDLIPYEHGEALFQAANEPKGLLDINGGHMDGYLMSETIYLKAWQEFLKDYIYEEEPEIKEEKLTQAN